VIYRNTAAPTDGNNTNKLASSYGSDLNTSYDSDLGSSTDKLDEGSDSWMYPSRRPKGLKNITPPSLAEQLKERLAEREGRKGSGEDASSRDSSDDYTEINRSTSNPATLMSQNLLVEIKKAVHEAQPKGDLKLLSAPSSPQPESKTRSLMPPHPHP
jgi:neurabin